MNGTLLPSNGPRRRCARDCREALYSFPLRLTAIIIIVRDRWNGILYLYLYIFFGAYRMRASECPRFARVCEAVQMNGGMSECTEHTHLTGATSYGRTKTSQSHFKSTPLRFSISDLAVVCHCHVWRCPLPGLCFRPLFIFRFFFIAV